MQLRGLFYRQSCPGGAYYVCQNGFKGCCSINPCDPGAVCPDSNTTPGAATSTRSTSSTTRSQTTTSKAMSTAAPKSSGSSTSSQTTSSSSSATSTTSAAPTATSLTCPAANGTTYTDPNKVRYSIRCSVDNSYSSFNSTTVSSGGFSKCFSPCDNLAACHGFTFVGSDSGTCYLKSDLPADSYTTTAGSNYVTVALEDRNAQVDPPADALPTGSSDTSKSSSAPVGAIVGGVIGGLALIILLALLLFCCLRRRRRKAHEITQATQKSQASPKEPHKHESPFAPYGGFYRGKSSNPPPPPPPKQPTTSHLTREDSAVNTFAKHDLPAPPPPPGPAEMEGKPIYPTAPLGNPPIEMDASSHPKPMSPVIDESPILGRTQDASLPNNRKPVNLADEVRRQQHSRHVLSWNTYDEGHLGVGVGGVSPPGSSVTGMSPRIGSPDVSPLIGQTGGNSSPPQRSNLGG